MKKVLLFSVMICILISSSFVFGDGNVAKTGYWGLQYADVETSLNEGGQTFDFKNINLNFGYRYSEILTFEFMITGNVSDERDDIMSSIIGQQVNAELNGYGLFALVQTPGKFYVKARAGLAVSRFVYTASGYEDEDEKDSGFSYGIGAGVRVGKGNLEIEYIEMPTVDDPLFSKSSYDTSMITVGFTHDF